MPGTFISTRSRAQGGFWKTYLQAVKEDVASQVATVFDVIALDDVGNAVKTAVSGDTPGTALALESETELLVYAE